MQVQFKYNNGEVVRMERVYDDILQRIKKGVVVDETEAPAEQAPARTSHDGDVVARPQQTSTRRTPQHVANGRRTGNNGGNGRRRR